MLNLREVEEAIRDLENGSATFNNCMKLASLYIVRDELRQKDYPSNYGYRPYYYPMYERGGRSGNSGSSSYGYRKPIYYTDDDLMIKKDHMPMQSEMYTQQDMM